MKEIYNKTTIIFLSIALVLLIPLSTFSVMERRPTYETPQGWGEGTGSGAGPEEPSSPCYDDCGLSLSLCVIVSSFPPSLLGYAICYLKQAACYDSCDRESSGSTTGTPAGPGSPSGGPNIMRRQN
jgi:hypothetical protein